MSRPDKAIPIVKGIRMTPDGEVSVDQSYQRNTPILVTRKSDEAGNVVEIVDFCPRFQRLGKADDAGLAAGNRGIGLVFSQAECALDAAGLGARHVAGDPAHLGVVVRIDDDLVVRADELEDGVHLADGFGPGRRSEGNEQGGREGCE